MCVSRARAQARVPTRVATLCACVSRRRPASFPTLHARSTWPLSFSLYLSCVCAPDRRHTCMIAVLRRTCRRRRRRRRMERTRCVYVCVRKSERAREHVCAYEPPWTHVNVYRSLPPCVSRRRRQALVASFRYQRETSLSLPITILALSPSSSFSIRVSLPLPLGLFSFPIASFCPSLSLSFPFFLYFSLSSFATHCRLFLRDA